MNSSKILLKGNKMKLLSKKLIKKKNKNKRKKTIFDSSFLIQLAHIAQFEFSVLMLLFQFAISNSK